MVPHFVQTMRGPNEGTVRSPGRWSTLMIISCRHWWHWTASDSTPFSRMLPSVVGSIGSLNRDLAITIATTCCRAIAARHQRLRPQPKRGPGLGQREGLCREGSNPSRQHEHRNVAARRKPADEPAARGQPSETWRTTAAGRHAIRARKKNGAAHRASPVYRVDDLVKRFRRPR
jgi:hypothetical protein